MTKWHNWTRLGLLGSALLACNSREADEHPTTDIQGGNTNSSTSGASTGRGGSGSTTTAMGGKVQNSSGPVSAGGAVSSGGNAQNTTEPTNAGGAPVTSGGASVASNNGGSVPTSGGAPMSAGGIGTLVGSGGAYGCTTQPPAWSDCDAVGDFQSTAATAGSGGVGSPPETLKAISDPSPLAVPLREQAKISLQAQYASYWQSQRSANCSPRVVCPSSSTRAASNGYGGAVGSVPSASTGGSAASTETRSGTNNQVDGVDEPDLMKLDARYVYIVTPTELLILDAQNPATTTASSRLKLEGTPKSLLINGDRALVIASTGSVPQKAKCTYAYDCQFSGDGYATLLLVIDIADRAKPRLIRRVQLSGSYLAGRMIGTAAHIVTSDVFKSPVINWQTPNVRESTATASLAALNTQYQSALSSVDTAAVTFTLPTTTDQPISSDGVAAAAVAVQPSQLHAANGTPGGVLTVTSFDFVTTDSLHQDMIFSNPGALYASQNLLYMAIPEVNSNYAGYGVDATWIHGFVLSGASATYQGSGRVKGHVLNQFSLDEYQSNLRIATSTGRVPDPSVHSTVSILGWQGERLTPLGAVDNIAPTEDIRAVRFAGSRGYVVTFKKTDPLFVLDLANPQLPKLEGELKIPGFSTYIHPLDDKHLLTMGYDADDQGSFAFFNGIQLQIMDVAESTNPKLLFKETIGTRGSSSEALTDHLAFNYFAPKKMLAIPMTICEGGGNGKYADVLTFTGLLVYDVSLEAGFNLHGRVPHPAPAGYYGTSSQPTCSNWWTNASSPVKRSAFIEEYMLSLGDALVKIDPLANLGQSVATFPVGAVPCEVLAEADCKLNSHCQAIRGTTLGSSAEEYLGCASIPSSSSSLSCQTGNNCITSFSSKACATVKSSCVPDGWGALATGTCTATVCGK